jgi:UDP-N-acetylmuramoylalanine--D-glutamate ligase
MMEINKTRFSILGMARSGIAAAQKILDNKGEVFLSELQPHGDLASSIIKQYGEAFYQKMLTISEFAGHTERVLDADYIIVSPGIPLNIPIIRKAQTRNIPVISEIEFGYLIKNPDSKIIAVTGSNGKSTVVSLIHYILQRGGYNTILAGNIGQALTSFPIELPGIDYIVLELSSFQLELVNKFTPDTAVLLNITPDHLDRYKSLDEYLQAKLRIFKNQTHHHRAVLNADDPMIMSHTSKIKASKHFFTRYNSLVPVSPRNWAYNTGEEIYYPDKRLVVKTTKARIAGIHNKYNIMAAILALGNIYVEPKVLGKAITSFTPLEHRLEYVDEINGVTFINDSKATNSESVKYALSAYGKPLHLIAGGLEKGEDFAVLLPVLQKYAKRIYLIGSSRAKMKEAFAPLKEIITSYDTLQEAVESAYNNAVQGDIVLLSPACASYDMFKNYEYRGLAFKDAVKSLTKLITDK